MTDTKEIEALAFAIQDVTTILNTASVDSKDASLILAKIEKRGYTITPINAAAPPPTDEKLREAVRRLVDGYDGRHGQYEPAHSRYLIEAVLAELERLRKGSQVAQAMPVWQPIETCLKEKGRPILLLDIEGVIDVGWWNNDYKNRDGYIVSATHWMPLPPPPATEGK